MKTLPAGLQSQLDAGVTTLCRCWLLVRTDGVKIGFTDHDQDLTFDGVTYEALAGITAGAINQTDALNVDTVEIAGALQSEHLDESDLAAGLYDDAGLTLYLVDWSNPANRDIMFAGSIGEVSRGLDTFNAEMRGLSHKLNQPTGRLYQASCDADLGDSRCEINLATMAYTGTGTVTSVSSNYSFAASGLGAYAGDWFARGKLTWLTGANASAAMDVKFHANSGGAVSFDLCETMAFDIAVGDTFSVAAGCDKSVETCIGKFNNVAKFRGFPFIPGNDAVVDHPSSGDVKDGGSRVGN